MAEKISRGGRGKSQLTSTIERKKKSRKGLESSNQEENKNGKKKKKTGQNSRWSEGLKGFH